MYNSEIVEHINRPRAVSTDRHSAWNVYYCDGNVLHLYLSRETFMRYQEDRTILRFYDSLIPYVKEVSQDSSDLEYEIFKGFDMQITGGFLHVLSLKDQDGKRGKSSLGVSHTVEKVGDLSIYAFEIDVIRSIIPEHIKGEEPL